MNTLTYILIGIIIALQAADIWTTQRTINNGTGEEANPLAKWFFTFLPQSMWWLPKVVLVGPICIVAFMFPRIEAIIVLIPLCVYYAYTCWQNYKIGSK